MKLMNKRIISLLLALVMILGMMPMTAFAAEETGSGYNELAGKTISILGASISTYTGISNNPDYNSTIGNNAVYYTEGKLGVYKNDTWWMQVANDLGLELLVNNSWSGSSLLHERNGTVGAYVDRCVQLHNNEGEMPDIIAIQMGTNDFQYYKDTLGTADIDYAALITENEDDSYTYAEPTTSLEAAAIVLHKISIRYPDAEVYYLNISQRIDGTDELIRSFNAELKQVVEHFGAHIVDIYGSAITMDDFDTYIGDGRVHPNCLGMDAYTEAFKRALLTNTAYEVDAHTVSLDLDGVTADYGDDKIVVSGDAFSCELTAEDGKELSVSVTMGGADITDTAYENGAISIEYVTDDVVITAEATVHKSQNYRWEFDGTDLACVSGGNALTKDSGTTTEGVFSKTSYTLKNEVVLMHDLPWIVEWKCEGTFLNTNGSSGARIFTSDNVNANYNARYIFKSNTNGIVAMGEKTSSGSHNYGIALADHGIDWTELHTYRLENRIAADGSNMIYLLVDGEEIGPMNHYYIGTKDQNTTSDWLSGKDFVFPYMGTDTHGFTNASINYIQVWEGGHNHTYENGTCTGCGATVSPYLQQLPENILGCTNVYDSLVPVKGYYTATKYDTSNGAVLSVVIPVEPGDRIAASSFGSVSENMGSVNGIRVTYLLGDEIVTSLSAAEVYSGYTSNGYLTVPDGVNAVCVPWWKPSDSNWLTLGQISKDFAVHITKTVPAQAPTCTEKGYTAGEICEICNASLGEREEIPATGHSYSGDTCTICGTVNLLAFLDGKYVSVLGDSISTFNGYSNDATVNTTIGGNGPRYDAGTSDTKPGSYCLLESVNDTWWMHFANRSGMKLLVNNSWAGSQVFGGQTSDGRVIPAAYLDRCVNLHDNTLENNPGNAPINPDVIFVYLGINDYNFNRGKVGTGTVDYAGLVDSDGTYVTPATFGEAYGIMLHKMRNAYPDAQIFAMTLLPENLYSVDKTAWEQHNAYIRAAAEYYNIPVVDLATNCAITWENYSGYMIDKIHPTTAGMELISDCIEAELVAYYEENSSHTHTYTSTVTAPTCTDQGYTTYTCACGESYVDDYVDALGHTYENGICTLCGEAQPGPVITQQPVNGEAKLGERYCVTVEAEGEGLTYQWYLRNAGSKSFSKSSVKDNTYDDVMTESRAGREVYCVITDANGNSVKTDTVKLVLLPSEELAIVTQPTDGEAVLGERYCVTVEAKGEGLKYQWYFRNKGATRWTKSSVTDNTYDDIMNNTRNGREVKCVITDRFGNSVTTDIVKLVRVPMKLEIISQPTDAEAAFGETFCATVVAKGEGLKYQWYYRNAGSATWRKSGVRDNTYNDVMTKARAGREVYCVITDKYGNSVTTDIVKLIAVPKVELKLLDVTYEAAALGERYCVTLNVQGEGLTYTWYFRNAGATRWSKSSVRDNTYDDVMNKTRANREVYCVITDACGNQIITEVITLTVEK